MYAQANAPLRDAMDLAYLQANGPLMRFFRERAMADYFAPLKAWLDKQNAGKRVGW